MPLAQPIHDRGTVAVIEAAELDEIVAAIQAPQQRHPLRGRIVKDVNDHIPDRVAPQLLDGARTWEVAQPIEAPEEDEPDDEADDLAAALEASLSGGR